MIDALYTLGVYGSTEQTFFDAVLSAQIDTFVDVRDRRGLRGNLYAYANAAALQRALADREIRYVHLRELAPGREIRQVQYDFDRARGVAIRAREQLSGEFLDRYTAEVLDQFTSGEIVRRIGEPAGRVLLFCVEREPLACHRSALAAKLSRDLGVPVEHLVAG